MVRALGFTAFVGANVIGVLWAGWALSVEGRTEPQGTAQQMANAAQRLAEDLASSSQQNLLGTLNAAAQMEFRTWALAIGPWKKEKSAGAAALLADGVLSDCLGRLQGVSTGFTSGLMADPRFRDLGTSQQPERAAKLFGTALKMNPELLEARFRAARIRAIKEPGAAVALEQVATAQVDHGVSYLAAVSRAAIAHQRHDTATAIRWYHYAQGLHARSTAAAIGLSALEPASRIDFDSLDPDDPYYNYPCRILTDSVRTELVRRIQGLPSK